LCACMDASLGAYGVGSASACDSAGCGRCAHLCECEFTHMWCVHACIQLQTPARAELLPRKAGTHGGDASLQQGQASASPREADMHRGSRLLGVDEEGRAWLGTWGIGRRQSLKTQLSQGGPNSPHKATVIQTGQHKFPRQGKGKQQRLGQKHGQPMWHLPLTVVAAGGHEVPKDTHTQKDQ
jgi:hypothetical protein